MLIQSCKSHRESGVDFIKFATHVTKRNRNTPRYEQETKLRYHAIITKAFGLGFLPALLGTDAATLFGGTVFFVVPAPETGIFFANVFLTVGFFAASFFDETFRLSSSPIFVKREAIQKTTT